MSYIKQMTLAQIKEAAEEAARMARYYHKQALDGEAKMAYWAEQLHTETKLRSVEANEAKAKAEFSSDDIPF